MEKGIVYLVGSGPGDPGLITVKGLQCIRKADVIIYDRLVADELLAETKAGAELIYVGKESRDHTLPQREINALLAAKAKEGKIVARLKGGDPFVFGRGGEEAEVLVREGIPFEVVPGITAAVAVPAYAGIPVTHRGFTSSFSVITGHEDPTKERSSIAWDKLAPLGGTLVFLMGVERVPEIAAKLIENGRPASTPVALVRWGTTPEQEALIGTLDNIADKVKESNFAPPAVIIVGEVVGLREKLRWFDNKPLFGKKVLITRTRKQASVLAQLLAQYGAQPVELPTIEITPVENYSSLDNAIFQLSDYDWVVLTSANGVEALFDRLHYLGLDAREFKGVKICAIGPATAKALEDRGLRADYVPEEYVAEGILGGFEKLGVAGAHFLLPRAEVVRETLAEGLRSLGAEVEEIAVYRTLPAGPANSEVLNSLRDGKIDIVTFTSSSTVTNLAALLGEDLSALRNTMVACIGPVTAKTATSLGIRVDIVAREHTIPGLVKAIVETIQGS